MSRRFVLTCSTLVVVLPCFATRARATSKADVEVSAYEGQTSGNWGCGPNGNVRYGGLAAEVRHSQRRPSREEGMGFTGVVGVAAEYDHVSVLKSSEDPERLGELETTHFGSLLGGAHARLGYHFHYVGIEAGVVGWSGFKNPDIEGSADIAFGALPQVQLSLGPRDFFYGIAGVGVPQLTQTMRYGLPYVGLGYVFDSGARVETRLGVHRAGPAVGSSVAPRLDVQWYVPIDSMWFLRAGLGLGDSEKAEREASLGFLVQL